MKIPRRYKPTGKSFNGGMSHAIQCDDEHLERKVLVKSLMVGAEPARILDELAALQSIRSKHVVQIYDVITDAAGEPVGIVEEFIPGDDLTLFNTPTTVDEFLKVLYQIAEGIRDIHAHGVIHRDIKRQNMKFDAERCLKIFDFGLARDEANASTIGEKGTEGYMAPELFVTSSHGKVLFTPAVDVFAFAATALAIMLGKPPKGLRESPPVIPCSDADFTKLALAIPADVAHELNRCLSLDPLDRPTMDEVARLIERNLLRDQHRALLVSGGATYTLSAAQRIVEIAVKDRGAIKIEYDGQKFVVTFADGDVAINNMGVSAGFELPGSCVIALGAPELKSRRVYITVDVSHPEVTL